MAANLDAPVQRRFDPPNFLLYFGAITAVLATSGLVGTVLEDTGAGATLAVSCAYIVAYAMVSFALLRRGWETPSGLFAAMAVAVVPLAIYAFERLIDVWPQADPGRFVVFHEEILGGWIAMELVTAAAGLVAIAFVRVPFIAAPVGFVLWYFSMDLGAALFGEDATPDELAGVSLGVGSAMIAVSLLLDARGHRGYAFWGHVFGFLALTGSTVWFTFDHNTGLIWSIVLAVSLFVLAGAVLLRRATFAVFGGIGLFASLVHFGNEIFEESWAFPFVITFVGVAFLAFGMILQARGEHWREALLERLGRRGA